MLIRDHWKKSWRMLLVSTLLVFMLNTMPAAATFVDYEDQVRWDLAVISETLELIYISLETYLPDISELISGLEVSNDYLSEIQNYVNASVSHFLLSNSYLSKIESHLATIASSSGSSGSSSGTDLTEVLSRLDTLTGLIGTTQLRVDSVLTSLEGVNTYLYQVSTKLDGVSTMVTNLNTANTYLSSIDSDVEDVLESLETATGLIGTISLDTDALVAGMGVTQDLIAAANTNLTTMINKQELVFDYLVDLSGDLGTVSTYLSWINDHTFITNGLLEQMNTHLSAVSTKLDGIGTAALETSTINYYLYWLGSDVQDILKKLETELDGISTIVTELTEARTYFAWINDHTYITNGLLEQMNTHLSAVSTKLDGIGTVALETNTLNYYLHWISYDVQGVLKKLETDTANQQKIIDLLEDLELTTNVTIENIENITIDVTNKAYEVFYITDSEGNEQNLADFSGDVLTISGRLLNFFFKVAFDDALDSVDSALNDLTEFYIDDSVLVGGGSLWE